ncbi:MAG: response regulator [Chloroflexota bacterium]|nr:MAG: response regulator [Chloroflexota bacterium]
MAYTSTRTVLVVDDDRDTIILLSFVLEEEGFTVLTAEDGLSALHALEDEQPGLILLDLHMPGMNGWELAGEIRRLYGRQLPIVVMTGGDLTSPTPDRPADGYLPKPFDIDNLVATVLRYGRFAPSDADGTQTQPSSLG